jgi:hypothetical protein
MQFNKEFEGLQISKSCTFHLKDSPSRIFPLLCPKIEFDWVDGWECDIVYSESGYAEKGCIFTTCFQPEGYAVWIMTDYQQDTHLRIVKTCEYLFLLEWTFDLLEINERSTDLKMIYSMTGLTEKGNDYVENTMDIVFPQLMGRLEKSMNYFLMTGMKLIIS